MTLAIVPLENLKIFLIGAFTLVVTFLVTLVVTLLFSFSRSQRIVCFFFNFFPCYNILKHANTAHEKYGAGTQKHKMVPFTFFFRHCETKKIVRKLSSLPLCIKFFHTRNVQKHQRVPS